METLTFIDRLLDGSLFNSGLATPILDWRRGQKWTMGRAMEGTLIVGSTGSGIRAIGRELVLDPSCNFITSAQIGGLDHGENLS